MDMDFDFSSTDEWQGYKQRNLNIGLIVVSTLLVLARFYVRFFMTKAVGLDDVATGIAYAFLVAFSSMEIRSVGLGSGSHIYQIPEYFIPKFFEAFTIQHLMYFWCVGLVRIAIVFFLLRLGRGTRLAWYNTVVYTTGVVILIQTVSCFLFRLLECKDISHLFLPPGSTPDCLTKDKESIMMYVHGGVGILVDVALLAVPIWVIKSQMMFSAKMVRVVLIFCVGMFASITGIVRLALMLQTDFAVDTTYKMVIIAFWTDLEGHVGFWCACFPALQPLIRWASYRLGLRSQPYSSGAAKASNYGAKSDAGLGSRSATGNGTWVQSNGYVRNGSGVDHKSDVEHDAESSKGIIAGAYSSVELQNMDRDSPRPAHGQIVRKTEVSVQVDDSSSIEEEKRPQGRWGAM